jgi:hypothetical protein
MGWGFGGFWRVEGVDMRICWGFEGKTTAEIYGDWEDGNSVVPRFALHSGLRQSGSVLRTRLLWPA